MAQNVLRIHMVAIVLADYEIRVMAIVIDLISHRNNLNMDLVNIENYIPFTYQKNDLYDIKKWS